MDNKAKKKITEEWLKKFPSLCAYTQNRLYKIVGPFICGIELINLPRSEAYRPHFVLYPLYKNDVKSCLDYPILMFEFYNDKKMQLELAYNDIDEKLRDTLNIVSSSLQISLENDVPLDSLYRLIDDIQKNNVIYRSHSGKIASLFELKFYAALYVRDQKQIQNVLNQIKQSSKGWDQNMFEVWYGKFGFWFEKLQDEENNREAFLKKIEVNMQEKKISKLKCSELIIK